MVWIFPFVELPGGLAPCIAHPKKGKKVPGTSFLPLSPSSDLLSMMPTPSLKNCPKSVEN
jgi:hypothetical protein